MMKIKWNKIFILVLAALILFGSAHLTAYGTENVENGDEGLVLEESLPPEDSLPLEDSLPPEDSTEEAEDNLEQEEALLPEDSHEETDDTGNDTGSMVPVEMPSPMVTLEEAGTADGDFVPGEVLAPADSLEEAQWIAASYGLRLKSYAYGVAVLSTLDPELSVARSFSTFNDTAGLPELSINWIYTTCDVQTPQAVINEIGQFSWDRNTTSDILTQYHHDEMDTRKAHDITTGKGVVVAVIDTGIDTTHPKFSGRISNKSYDSVTESIGVNYVMDGNGHGTHVSGIIAASYEQASSVFGVAPDVTILAIKANTGSTANFDSAFVIRGIKYATANGAHVINMSLGRPFSGGPSALELTEIKNAVEKGVTVIAAAGNSSEGNAAYPAAYPEVIAVSAVKQNNEFDNEYSKSNYGPQINISAPGANIYSTVPGGYGYKSGTSMASPNVAGVAALIKACYSSYTPQQIRNVLCETAREAGVLGWDPYYGYGVVNAYAAVLLANNLCTVTFNFNDGSRAPIQTKIAPESRLIKPQDPTRANHTFQGWYTSQTGGSLFNFANTIGGNITLFAQWQAVTPAPTAPTAPQNLKATPGNSRVTLNWAAPANNGGAAITNYQVSPNNGASWVNASTNTGHTFTGLANAVSLTFRVRAVNSVGNGAQASITSTPGDAITLFVSRLYRNVLNREPDAGGLQYWSNLLRSGTTGGSVARGFFFSPEFINRGTGNSEFLDILYQTLLNRPADAGGKAYWLNQMLPGYPRENIFAGFVNSTEFDNLCKQAGIVRGTYMPPPGGMVRVFVTRLYRETLSRSPDQGGLDYWTDMLLKGASGSSVARGFVFSRELTNKNLSDADYVEVLYKTLMGRGSDASGKAYWMNQLRNGASRQAVFNGFANSREFGQICQTHGIKR